MKCKHEWKIIKHHEGFVSIKGDWVESWTKYYCKYCLEESTGEETK